MFVIFLLVVGAVIGSFIFPDYMLRLLVPVIIGIPVIITVFNIVTGQPLLTES